MGVAGAGTRNIGHPRAPVGTVDRLPGPGRDLLSPAVVRSISGALQSGMETILWAVAAIAFAGFAASLFFPALKVPPREKTGVARR